MPEGKDGESTVTNTVTLEIDGEQKSFSADDVKNLVAQQASATQKTQQVASILKVAERYGVGVDDYLHNAEGSLALMNDLIDKGIIDEHGTILEKKVELKAEAEPKKGERDQFDFKSSPPEGFEKKLAIALKAATDPMMDKMSKLENDNILLMKLRLQDQAMRKFDNLDEGDVAKIFTLAERERNKSFIECAEDYSKGKQEHYAKLEAKWAEDHGINLEEVKERKLFEQDPTGGAAALFKEKKLSFKRGKDSVSPFQATKALFEKMS